MHAAALPATDRIGSSAIMAPSSVSFASAGLLRTLIRTRPKHSTFPTFARAAMSTLLSDTHPSTNVQGFYAWTDTLKGVYYGPGSLPTALPKLRAAIGGTKALVVTGKSLFNKVCPARKPSLRPNPHA